MGRMTLTSRGYATPVAPKRATGATQRDDDGFWIEKAEQIDEASGPICGHEIPDFGNLGLFSVFLVISFFYCL